MLFVSDTTTQFALQERHSLAKNVIQFLFLYYFNYVMTHF